MGPDKSVHSREWGIVYIQEVHFQQKRLWNREMSTNRSFTVVYSLHILVQKRLNCTIGCKQ